MRAVWHEAIQLYQYRDLVRNLVVRDLKVRYKSSALGIAWSMLNPLGMMLVFTVVFTIMLPSNVERYPVFILCGLLPWNWFSGAVMGSLYSVVGNAALVKKVYFPRDVLPLSIVLSNLVHFLLALVVLFALMLFFHTPFTGWVLLLPLIMLVQLIFTLGLAFFLSAVNVYYRDTAQIVEVLMLAWFFLTPVFYSMDIVPQTKEVWGYVLPVQRLAYIFNPMSSLIASYRVILYDGAPPAFDFLLRTIITSLIVLVLGYLFFRRASRSFGEVL